mmetsp:Transcript_18945/g.38592  ORF Transcript_18945/g.38592 Transcript_18945/m.38592 type:complete len:267 (+) Transcript_18945:164-964(+)
MLAVLLTARNRGQNKDGLWPPNNEGSLCEPRRQYWQHVPESWSMQSPRPGSTSTSSTGAPASGCGERGGRREGGGISEEEHTHTPCCGRRRRSDAFCLVLQSVPHWRTLLHCGACPGAGLTSRLVLHFLMSTKMRSRMPGRRNEYRQITGGRSSTDEYTVIAIDPSSYRFWSTSPRSRPKSSAKSEVLPRTSCNRERSLYVCCVGWALHHSAPSAHRRKSGGMLSKVSAESLPACPACPRFPSQLLTRNCRFVFVFSYWNSGVPMN